MWWREKICTREGGERNELEDICFMSKKEKTEEGEVKSIDPKKRGKKAFLQSWTESKATFLCCKTSAAAPGKGGEGRAVRLPFLLRERKG